MTALVLAAGSGLAGQLIIAPGDSGWAAYTEVNECAEAELELTLRLGYASEARNARILMQELRVQRRSGLTARFLGSLPIRGIESCVNRPAFRGEVAERLPPAGVERPFPEWVDWAGAQKVTPRAPSLTLVVPPGRPKPDAFYSDVAEAFSYLTVQSQRPAAEMAEANNVPVTTVHGWVKGARRRGFLPAGERSR